jgi:D-amino-acid dehydrogenase
VRTLAKHAEQNGVRHVQGSVDSLQVDNGELKEIKVGDQRIACAGAVISTGVWSGPLASQLGVKVPLESERGYHLEFWDPSEVPVHPTMLAACKAVATPMDGRLRIAGAVEFGGTKAPASEPPFDLLRQNVEKMLPNMKYSKVTQWMGHRPAPADSIPIIGAAPAVRNAWLAFGHHHVGLTTGPKTGRLVAQLVAGEQTSVDMTPYSPSRFST